MAAPIYLFSGPEFGKRDSYLEDVKKSARKKYPELDEHHIYLLESPLAKAMSILENGTLFSDGVFLVCKNAEVIKRKEEIEIIKNWLDSNPSDNAILVFISDEISVDSKLEKLIPAENRKKCWEMYENERLPWIKNFFAKKGYGIQGEACQLILDMVENNTQALGNECSRLMVCFPQSHEINCDDVESVLTHNREESAFTLFNTICHSEDTKEKRFENGLNILQKVRLSKDNNSVQIIAGLTSCFRRLITWHRIHENGIPDDFTLKTKGFSGATIKTQYRNAAKIWTIGQATAILAILASTDMEIRSGGSFMEDLLLQKMLYEIIIKKGALLLNYEA